MLQLKCSSVERFVKCFNLSFSSSFLLHREARMLRQVSCMYVFVTQKGVAIEQLRGAKNKQSTVGCLGCSFVKCVKQVASSTI